MRMKQLPGCLAALSGVPAGSRSARRGEERRGREGGLARAHRGAGGAGTTAAGAAQRAVAPRVGCVATKCVVGARTTRGSYIRQGSHELFDTILHQIGVHALHRHLQTQYWILAREVPDAERSTQMLAELRAERDKMQKEAEDLAKKVSGACCGTHGCSVHALRTAYREVMRLLNSLCFRGFLSVCTL